RSVGDNGCTGVEFQSRFDGANTYIPDYGTVDNCSINVLSGTVTTGRYATGVKQFYSGTIPVGLAQWGLTVSNCDINARYIGIFLGQTAGATIHDNTIRLNQYSASTHIYGIYHLNASGNNGASGWTMDIFNNKFDELINVNTGTSVIYLGTGTYSVAHDPITFNVYNNMICGFDFTVATPTANIYYRGISCDYASDVSFDINCNFYNNSIYMPHFPNLTYTLENTTSRRCAYAIGSPNTSWRARTLRFRNNNLRVEQFYAASIHYARYSTNAIVDIDYNNISADTANGAYVGRLHDYYAFFEYTTVEDWRTASGKPDANSFTVNPLVPHAPFTGTWTAANDLYFTSYPSAKMAGAPIAAVTADIDGAPRSTIAPLMGCHELALTGAKIVLLADTLDFGYRKLIPNNGVSVNGKVKYRNVGPVPLSLTGAALVAGSTDFSFVSAQSPIAPGATGECTVKYSPYNSGLTTGTLRISTSNDFYEPTVDFNVQGIGTLPRVSVGAPTGTNWGYCFVGQNQGTKKVRISNIGNVPLLVTGITITGDPDMSVVYVPSTPFTLPAFGYYEAITLEYTPSSIGLHQKFISVTTDDYLNSPINLTIEGTGIEVTAAEEPFFVGYAKTAAV
ncbi:MAG TPA: choice-of-anchor D domain-containing protein, partial [Candidatus Sumerlaeota bacterium]|nr:choice-of-anchor D domain-containing protein [Candidatus Sumerlaeota bacterium]